MRCKWQKKRDFLVPTILNPWGFLVDAARYPNLYWICVVEIPLFQLVNAIGLLHPDLMSFHVAKWQDITAEVNRSRRERASRKKG